MARRLLAILVVALGAGVAAAAPVDSDLALATMGGGCRPTGLHPALLDMLTLVNPEWAPIETGMEVDAKPVLVHGVVEGMHGDTSGDFPASHLRADVNHFVRLDPADAGRLATGNEDGLLHFEWEAGVYPAWAWASPGDRIVGLGRWIFDCGHPDPRPGNCSATAAQPCAIDLDCRPPACAACGAAETCAGAHWGYSAELHPPYATAAIRSGRGAVVASRRGRCPSPLPPVPATRADVYASAEAGGAGDRCILTHRMMDADLLSVECFPLSQPVAALNSRDFVFDLPLPPRPRRGRWPAWHVVDQGAPGGVPARLKIRPRPRGRTPHLRVAVGLRHKVNGRLPTGFAATIFAGWKGDRTPLAHVRVTLSDVVIQNALQPAVPAAPKACSTAATPCVTPADCPAGESCLGVGPVRSWQLQAAVDGEWQELAGLSSVSTGDVVRQSLGWDQYLPPDGALRLLANGVGHECIDVMYGQSLAADLAILGLNEGLACLGSVAHAAGAIDVSYPGPDFGAGDHETASTGGEGGHCSVDAGLLCVVDADCPSGETCAQTGGAFALRYRIERLS
jgi:hypothetical protein